MTKIKTEIKVKFSGVGPYVEKPQIIPLEADTQQELFEIVSLELWKLLPNIGQNKLVIDGQIEFLKQFGINVEVKGLKEGIPR